jgi:DNA-binding NtrC family response regulator
VTQRPGSRRLTLTFKTKLPINGAAMSTSSPVLAFPAPLRYPEPQSSTADKITGESEPIRRLRLQIQRIGPHFRTVLVRGEIGTGKELVARALHNTSTEPKGPFLVCHAAALEDAAADGTAQDWLHNLMDATQQGTLFLDGIEDMPTAVQARFVSTWKKRTTQRLITSTSADLRCLVASGAFRQDLYHRLATLEITVAPLRERTEDIAPLAQMFLERFSKLYGRPVHAIAQPAMTRLLEHDWPGNIRELENVIRNGVLQCEGQTLQVENLTSLRELKEQTERMPVRPARLNEVIDRHVQYVLHACGGNKVKAAELLGISRSTLYRMLEEPSA